MATAVGGGAHGGASAGSSADNCPEDPCTKVPRSVLVVALIWLAVLVALFFLYERDGAFKEFVSFKLGRLPFEAIFFGAVGGFLISSQGIFEHNRKWRKSYDYWHYARPILGAIVGTLGCLIFLVLNEAATKGSAVPNPVFYDVIALAIGYREESFRELIAKLFDTIILPGKAKSQGSQGDDEPQAKAGSQPSSDKKDPDDKMDRVTDDEPKPKPGPATGQLIGQSFELLTEIAALARSVMTQRSRSRRR
jgi:hypothetical protein